MELCKVAHYLMYFSGLKQVYFYCFDIRVDVGLVIFWLFSFKSLTLFEAELSHLICGYFCMLFPNYIACF
jgi:hypothetical protein